MSVPWKRAPIKALYDAMNQRDADKAKAVLMELGGVEAVKLIAANFDACDNLRYLVRILNGEVKKDA